jgi:hypothetical protein
MPAVQTYPLKLGNWLKHEYAPETGYCRDVSVLASGVSTAKLGTIVYRATVAGEWIVVPDTLAAGSQLGIIVERTDEITAGTDVVTLVRGPAEIRLGGTYRAGTTTDATVIAALQAQGIEVATISSAESQFPA